MGTEIVVVAADGTPIGGAVVRQAAVLASSMGASLHVVAAASEWDRARQVAWEWGLRVELHNAGDDLMASVWAVAERVEADRIVIDRARRGGFRRWLSSVRWRISPMTPRPVTVIDTSALTAPGPSVFDNAA
jgi:K+-sensing histidine kinase KdpD